MGGEKSRRKRVVGKKKNVEDKRVGGRKEREVQ